MKLKLQQKGGGGGTCVIQEDRVLPGTGVPAGLEAKHVEPAGPGDTSWVHLKLNNYVMAFVQDLHNNFATK